MVGISTRQHPKNVRHSRLSIRFAACGFAALRSTLRIFGDVQQLPRRLAKVVAGKAELDPLLGRRRGLSK